MDWWKDEFCARLAAGGRFVVRYDHRDTGRSVTSPPGAPDYSMDDLVADPVGVLDALGVARAHVVGLSMGGAIAQLVALDHADRVATLTLVATSPSGPGADGLPPMTDELQAYFAAASEPVWSDRAAVVDWLVEGTRPLAGSLPADEGALRRIAERVVDRSRDVAAGANHFTLEGGGPWRHRLGGITAPTLVVHGTEDPLFPLAHGRALADEIPGARLLPLDRAGHELPRPTWDVVVPALLAHTASWPGAGPPAAAGGAGPAR
jgi:pimeloyl-ACP methyl ester carboxylesterase